MKVAEQTQCAPFYDPGLRTLYSRQMVFVIISTITNFCFSFAVIVWRVHEHATYFVVAS